MACGLQKIFVRVEDIVAEKFVKVAVIFAGAGFQDGVDVAAAIAALARVVE